MNEVLGHPSSTMKSKYKYVVYRPDGSRGTLYDTARKLRYCEDNPWVAIPATSRDAVGFYKRITKRFATEREAALFVDKWFISQGREPVNILKPKQ